MVMVLDFNRGDSAKMDHLSLYGLFEHLNGPDKRMKVTLFGRQLSCVQTQLAVNSFAYEICRPISSKGQGVMLPHYKGKMDPSISQTLNSSSY